MLKNRLIYICLLIIAVFIYIFTNTYYTLSLLLLVVALPLTSLCLMMISSRSVDIHIDIAPTMEKDEVYFDMTFSNKSFLPVARIIVPVIMENQLTGTSVQKKLYISLGSRKTNKARLQIKNARIGTLTVKAEKTKVYDIFGLFSYRIPYDISEDTVVYPRLLDMEIHMDKPIETSGEGTRYSVDRKGMDNNEIFALRDYIAGDEIRKIHWKLSGKIDKMIVRDFSLPLNYSIFLLIELKNDNENITDAMMELYLSLSRALLWEGINHNLAWFDSGDETFHVRELDTFEDLEVAMSEILISFSGEGRSDALEYYMTSGYKNNESMLVYISSDPDTDKITELEMTQRVKTVYITEDKDVTEIDEVEVYTVNPEHIDEGLPEFII